MVASVKMKERQHPPKKKRMVGGASGGGRDGWVGKCNAHQNRRGWADRQVHCTLSLDVPRDYHCRTGKTGKSCVYLFSLRMNKKL